MPIAEQGEYQTPNSRILVSLTHENGSSINIEVLPGFGGGDSSPYEPYGDEAVQDLVNYLAQWEKLDPNNNIITAGKTRVYRYAVTPDIPE